MFCVRERAFSDQLATCLDKHGWQTSHKSKSEIWKVSADCPLSIQLNRAKLHRTRIYRAKLHRTRIYRAKLHRTRIYRAKLHRTRIYRAKLHRTRIYRAKLHRTRIYRARQNRPTGKRIFSLARTHPTPPKKEEKKKKRRDYFLPGFTRLKNAENLLYVRGCWDIWELRTCILYSKTPTHPRRSTLRATSACLFRAFW